MSTPVITDEERERYSIIGEIIFTDDNMRVMTSANPGETSHATRLYAAVRSGMSTSVLTPLELHAIATEYGPDWENSLIAPKEEEPICEEL